MIQHFLFDLLAWAAALSSGWLTWRWRLRKIVADLATRLPESYFGAVFFGTVSGAYGFGTLNLYISDSISIGRSVLGAFVGAIAAVEWFKWRHGIRVSTGVIFAIPITVAVTVGRIGCYRAGLEDLTFGTPTALPWGHDFGDGISRHPVQIYESIAMGLCTAILATMLALRSEFALHKGFYMVMGWYGAQRFIWEFLKPYGQVVGSLNIFHLLCFVLVAYSVWMIRYDWNTRT